MTRCARGAVSCPIACSVALVSRLLPYPREGPARAPTHSPEGRGGGPRLARAFSKLPSSVFGSTHFAKLEVASQRMKSEW
jgi:hypothetical protein